MILCPRTADVRRRHHQDGRDQSPHTGRRVRHTSASAHAEPAEAAGRVRQQADDSPPNRSPGHRWSARGKRLFGKL